MQWVSKRDPWRWWFAVLPICLGEGSSKRWLWLEWYQYRFAGLYYEIRPREAK
jgi:hypothetical protein